MYNISTEIIGKWSWEGEGQGYKYTQMVWADTEAVGCGFLTTKDITMEEDIARMKAEGTQNLDESVSITF